MTASRPSIEIAVPPERVWDVIMDPGHFDDWVTIHRKLGHVDDGPLREGFRVEQTLCLHHANFKVKWSLAEVRRAAPRGLGGQGAGRLARPHRRQARAARRRRAHPLRLPQRVHEPRRLLRPRRRPRARGGRGRARGGAVARAAQGVPRALSARSRWTVTWAGPSCGIVSMRQRSAAAFRKPAAGARPGSASQTSPRRGRQARQQRQQRRDVALLVEHVGGEHQRPRRAERLRRRVPAERPRLQRDAVALGVARRHRDGVRRPVGRQHAPAGDGGGDRRQPEAAAELDRAPPGQRPPRDRRARAPARSATARPSRAGTPPARTPPRSAAPRRRAARAAAARARERDDVLDEVVHAPA